MNNRIKTTQEIHAIRQSGKMLAEVLRTVEKVIEPGITGLEIDKLARKELKSLGGEPAFLGYQGFPGAICISVNDAVVHGIPSQLPLKNNDVVGFDFGVNYRGMITDAARTVIIGTATSDKVVNLVKNTKKSLDMAIKVVKNNCHVGDISAAAQAVMEEAGLGIIRDLVGHGVGHELHENPEIPNFGKAGQGPMLRTGMTIAIEPMATMSDWRVVIDPDGWTIRTRDGSLSAHFEDTILVTDTGFEILTR